MTRCIMCIILSNNLISNMKSCFIKNNSSRIKNLLMNKHYRVVLSIYFSILRYTSFNREIKKFQLH